ncbi:putative protein phosphatase [Plasmodium gaboni]|uniref:PPM-type phosphatase domain-containing protein n=1 Tax=Plasmodium gaboni TaxID=647221 RepID=A0A151LH38_9APIC|nr:putative protein phosphatase [Plasmodium gaboni]KYN98274.1 putative protein phosphatase [Plasmodium gaboni]
MNDNKNVDESINEDNNNDNNNNNNNNIDVSINDNIHNNPSNIEGVKNLNHNTIQYKEEKNRDSNDSFFMNNKRSLICSHDDVMIKNEKKQRKYKVEESEETERNGFICKEEKDIEVEKKIKKECNNNIKYDNFILYCKNYDNIFDDINNDTNSNTTNNNTHGLYKNYCHVKNEPSADNYNVRSNEDIHKDMLDKSQYNNEKNIYNNEKNIYNNEKNIYNNEKNIYNNDDNIYNNDDNNDYDKYCGTQGKSYTDMPNLNTKDISNISEVGKEKDELEDNYNDEKKNELFEEHSFVYPSIYDIYPDEWFRANKYDDWLVHKLCKWLYNINDKLYFNIDKQEIYHVVENEFVRIEDSKQLCVNNKSNAEGYNSRRSLQNKSRGIMGDNQDNIFNNNDDDTDSDMDYEINDDTNLYNNNNNNNNNTYNCEDIFGSHDNMIERNALRDDDLNHKNNINIDYNNNDSDDLNGDNDDDNYIYDNNNNNNNNNSDIFNNSNNVIHTIDRPRDVDSSKTLNKKQSNEESFEEFSMVLEDDLVGGTFSKVGEHNKRENEDFYITKDILDLNNVSDSQGLCFYSGIFDGHGGSNCARYVMNHLKTNVIAKFRQSFLITCKKKFKEKGSKLNELSVELRALYDSCIKGFDMTDKNYIELSKKFNYKDGSTACVVLIYGPDDDGSLKVLCANCGDSGAFICHNKKPIKLSLRHKPDLQEERIRILKCGGIIANINGINRIITKHKDINNLNDNNNNNKSKDKTFLALSTSRSFGDISYKIPRKIVQCKPFISVYTIDFDLDSFLVLATDGVLNVLTDEEIIDIIWKNIHRKPEQAAEEVVKEATRRGSTDDKTCTVIFFYWRKDIFNTQPQDVNVNDLNNEEDKGEDINMFSSIF